MQAWIGSDTPENAGALAEALQKAVETHQASQLKAFVIFVNRDSQPRDAFERQLRKFAGDHKLSKLDVAYVGRGDPGIRGYRINQDPAVRNTILVYRNEQVQEKLVNLSADEAGLKALEAAVEKVTK